MNTVKIICEYCKETFDKPISEVTRRNKLGSPMYCSLSCSVSRQQEKRREKKIERYKNKPVLCKHCGLPLEYEKRDNSFCNQSCAAKTNNVLTKRREIDVKCETCGININGKRKYCSVQCTNVHKTQILYKKIECGGYVNPYQIRRYLIEKRGERCEECGWDRVNKKSCKCPVQMDHVDGNAKNNQLHNLKLLCPNCHSLTPTFGSLNKGNGRPERRARYLKGIKTA